MSNKDRRIIIFIALLLYRIPLSHIIGDTGMGFLSGPMEVFLCLLMLFGSGLTISLKGMMKDRVRRGQYNNASQVFGLAEKYVLIAVIVLLAVNIGGYDFISTGILADSGQRLAYIFVGPALALGMLVDLNIGFLAGTDNGRAALIGEIAEAVSLGVFMILGGIIGHNYGLKIAALLINDDVAAMYGAMGVMAGLCLGELAGLIVLAVMSFIYKRTFIHLCRTDSTRRSEYISDVTGGLIGGVLTDGLLNFILQVPVIIMIVIYHRYAIRTGVEDATAMIGAFYAKYLSITGILSAMAVWSVPSGIKGIQSAVSETDYPRAGERISRLFGWVLYFAIPATLFTTMLVDPLMKALFIERTTTVSGVLTIGCSVIILYSLMYLFMAVLIGTGYHREMLFISGISLIITVILAFIMIGRMGLEFKGIALLLMVDYGINAVFCLLLLLRNYRMKLRLMQQVLIPLVISGVVGILIKLLAGAIVDATGAVLALIICIIPAWFAYSLACMFLRVCSAGTMERKFLGRLLVRLGQNLGIY